MTFNNNVPAGVEDWGESEPETSASGGANIGGINSTASQVLDSVRSTGDIATRIEAALGSIATKRDAALAELTTALSSLRTEKSIAVTAIHTAKNNAVDAVRAAANQSDQGRNADNPNFQTSERTTPDQPIQWGQPS